MNDAKLKTLAQVEAFLQGSAGIDFGPAGDDRVRYEHIGAVLRGFGYGRLRRPDKGLVQRYLAHTTGYSRAQLARLLKRALKGAPLVKRYRGLAHGFARLYTEQDVALLARTDTLHGTPSGSLDAWTKRIFSSAGNGAIYLYRAVDKHGRTVDFRLSEHRNIEAAKDFSRKALLTSGAPMNVALDGHYCSHRALFELWREARIWRRVKVRICQYLDTFV